MLKQIILGFLIASLLVVNVACKSNHAEVEKRQSNNITETQLKNETDDICKYSTKGNIKSEGLNIMISYPCNWTLKDGDRPHVVQKFSMPTTNNTLINGMIIITKLPEQRTPEEIKSLLLPSNLSTYVDPETDKVISAKSFIIDGEIAGELVFETNRKTPVGTFWMKSVEYLMIYKNYFIRLQYVSGSQYETQANNLFLQNQKLFAALATGTVIINKWENNHN